MFSSTQALHRPLKGNETRGGLIKKIKIQLADWEAKCEKLPEWLTTALERGPEGGDGGDATGGKTTPAEEDGKTPLEGAA